MARALRCLGGLDRWALIGRQMEYEQDRVACGSGMVSRRARGRMQGRLVRHAWLMAGGSVGALGGFGRAGIRGCEG